MKSINLKLLIVDDEPIICQGLKMTVPWHELGVEVVGEAYDGENALRIVRETHVDIILTDVNMPVMDGLKLTEKVLGDFPHIKMIIISGYDEFEYAQRALRLGVKDYLLKPVDIEELITLVNAIQKDMVEKNNKEIVLGMEQLLSSLVMKQDIDADFDFNGYQFLCSEIKDYASTINNKDKLLIKETWKKNIRDQLQKKGFLSVSAFIDENRLLTCTRPPVEFEQLTKCFKETADNIRNELGINISICYSPIIKDSKQLFTTYDHLIKGIKFAHCLDKSVFRVSDIPNQTTEIDQSKLERRLGQFLSEKEPQVQSCVEDIFSCFVGGNWLLEDVVTHLKEAETSVLTYFPELQSRIMSKDINLTVYNSYNELRKLFKEDIEFYLKHQQTTDQSSQHWVIMKAIKYMKDHYASDLKASEVADVINVSPNYFSHLIKQETGKHFNDYLHEIRLKQAMILLKETPYRVFEIAEMVGYKDYKYFVHIFKKSTSTTPTKYRNVVTSLDVK
ncbi:response regulator transcription factor [Metabacillus halosaccharovorans]|uniref:Response regulator n=1 Tax=Metabacillus halosaccharovorans TaxID=930124 RepID=A0ABT3DP50_9BACI|nr:response regulator [Metabacillus halosaccharovorans]MCV9888684.1 response regulator [Metabacillus halosaccharovorans]